MIKFNHPVYLTEKEICDQIDIKFYDYFDLMGDMIEYFREQSIGTIRPDFISFHKDFINIYEVKITANMDTIRQVIFYKRIIDSYIFENSRQKSVICPNIGLTIIARNFDSSILDLCSDLEINLYKIILENNQIIALELLELEYFPNVKSDIFFESKFKELYV